jgi:hypothetical protein
MQGWPPFASAPFWAIFIGTLLLVLLSVEGGYSWARSRRGGAREKEREKEAPVGAMVGTALGLLALMLAFTFAKAADHYHVRRVALFDEANAIRTMYSRAMLIEEPQRTEVRKLLREYTEERLQWDGSAKARASSSSTALLDRLSAQTAAAVERNPSPVVVSQFLGAMNDLAKSHAERIDVSRSRIPDAVWAVLYFIAVVSLGAMGYHCGVAGTTRSPVMAGVAIVFSLVIVLIVDLDRPGDGWIVVPQDAMVDVRNGLADSKP